MTEESVVSVWMGLGFSSLALIVFFLLALILSSYVKIATVLALLRAGLGFYSLPSALVTGGLAISLAFFTMYPTLKQTASAIDAARSGATFTDAERVKALELGAESWKTFVLRHAHAEERTRFAEIAHRLNRNTVSEAVSEAVSASAEVAEDSQATALLERSWQVLAPAFIVSQLKEAFKIGLTLLLPLLVIDLLVAQVLVALGLTQLSPSVVSLPIKLVVFVAVGGWSLITSNLVASYAGS